jgi:hypothetical protein
MGGVPWQTPHPEVRAFLRHRPGTLARLRRVNEALSRWDEIHTAAAMPAEPRPVVTLPPPHSWPG